MRVAIAFALGWTSIAGAQPGAIEASPPSATAPPRILLGFGTGLLGTTGGILSSIGLPYYVEVLVQPHPRVPVLAFGNYMHGSWGSGEGQYFGAGDWWVLRFGAEYRECTRRAHACFFADGAIGVMQFLAAGYTLSKATFPQTAPLLSARVGADVGWSHLRFRFGFVIAEPTRHATAVNACPQQPYMQDLGAPSGLEIGFAGAY
jgi:hypothetical protein